jgi:hypothetical protein
MRQRTFAAAIPALHADGHERPYREIAQLLEKILRSMAAALLKIAE